ncbi:TRAP transporter large permease [Marinobacterium marinum]|uniref:TRAP transporter large permease protein n=1 Tax=Marinobacterium marinum TaxID=2756129 RepID=A0A7W1WWT3_9GAMM|nr:TRAP transporter large permease subunit [Marinobacterium marinum]MBA4501678.1 TRAP transporter large permease subunit [Marinobacterium marinum]
MTDPIILGLLSIALIFILMGLGIPVFASLGITGIIGIILVQDFTYVYNVLSTFAFDETAAYLLTVIPLFIIMGNFALHAGVGKSLFHVARHWCGHLPGGLAISTILTCAGFSATSGSSVATAATVGSISLPEMKNAGYDRRLSAGCVAAGGVLGVLIPPSVLLVFYAALTEVSAGKMLIAGIVPGLLSVLVFVLGVFLVSLRHPDMCPPAERAGWRPRLKSLVHAWKLMFLIIVVLGSIYTGWATPTEAASLGAVASILFLLGSRQSLKNKLDSIGHSSRDAVNTTVMIMMTMLGAGIYSFFLSLIQVPQMMSSLVSDLPLPALLIIALILVIYIPMGMFLDAFSMLVITLPIVFPVVSELGYDPIWFGILAIKMCEIGLITPPIGLNVYVIAGIDRDTTLTEVFSGASWFILMELVTIVILFCLPALSTWLPYNM